MAGGNYGCKILEKLFAAVKKTRSRNKVMKSSVKEMSNHRETIIPFLAKNKMRTSLLSGC